MLKTLPDRVSPVVPLQASKLEQKRTTMMNSLCPGRSFCSRRRTRLCVRTANLFAEPMKQMLQRERRPETLGGIVLDHNPDMSMLSWMATRLYVVEFLCGDVTIRETREVSCSSFPDSVCLCFRRGLLFSELLFLLPSLATALCKASIVSSSEHPIICIPIPLRAESP
jgi:hypothetical protein